MKSHFSQLAIKWLEVVVRRASATTNYRGVWGVWWWRRVATLILKGGTPMVRAGENVDSACYRFVWRRLQKAVESSVGRLIPNPFIGGHFTTDDDFFEQVALTVSAVRAAVHFGTGPSGQRLPMNSIERAVLMETCLPRNMLWAFFSASLEANEFDYMSHPSFAEYAAGFIAVHNWRLLEREPSLASEFPPRPLEGLDHRSTAWRPMSRSGSN